jgi:hypothetical protein
MLLLQIYIHQLRMHILNQFPEYHVKTLLGGSSAKAGTEGIIKATVGNGSLHGIANQSGVRVINSAMSKNLIIKHTIYPHCNNHKYTWSSPDGTHTVRPITT